jgi:hypothetical protein
MKKDIDENVEVNMHLVDRWCMWELTEETIRSVASKNDCNLEGLDFDDIARRVKKGIAWAVDDIWEESILDAIKSADKEVLIRMK